ncbi:MAG: hypothetical protein KAU21_21600 [Gammaproteobacteria bacterium]|nr:hypothetical protein [Gammaproteobacteria bacterium]
MTDSPSINLTILSSELESFCQKLLSRSRDIAKTHDALITLESFISIFGRPAHGTKEYLIIESTIKAVTESSRQQLLDKSTADLLVALRQCNIVALTAVHTSLSRNGFYQILQNVISDLSDDDIRLLMVWSANWVKEAKQLAEEASGFPDALDFKKADISIEEFHAMNDIDRVLNVSNHP